MFPLIISLNMITGILGTILNECNLISYYTFTFIEYFQMTLMTMFDNFAYGRIISQINKPHKETLSTLLSYGTIDDEYRLISL